MQPSDSTAKTLKNPKIKFKEFPPHCVRGVNRVSLSTGNQGVLSYLAAVDRPLERPLPSPSELKREKNE